MSGVVSAAIRTASLWLLRRRQLDSARLRSHFRSRHDVEVGLYSYGCFDPWRMPGPLRVGRYCSIAATARVAQVNHPLQAITTHPVLYEPRFGVARACPAPAGPLTIEDDVWIGHNALILPGCRHIGRGAVVGAGAVVTRDVAAYTVVVGNPARKLRDRFPPDLVQALEASRWWLMDLAELASFARERPDLVFSPTVHGLAGWGAAAPGTC